MNPPLDVPPRPFKMLVAKELVLDRFLTFATIRSTVLDPQKSDRRDRR